ncbi:hypothetical protein GDO81_018746 [Engystomops pustulosus]|uniref:Uncharacterized protein n=1 Tax=Engystomops pustulosus TaxID=76066 RepID=A0AAV6ZIY3_ENGPU|nr:hypothetical protein GDO81_018746 [Engystomops pustulosus]
MIYFLFKYPKTPIALSLSHLICSVPDIVNYIHENILPCLYRKLASVKYLPPEPETRNEFLVDEVFFAYSENEAALYNSGNQPGACLRPTEGAG